MNFLPGWFPGAGTAATKAASINFLDLYSSETDTNAYNRSVSFPDPHPDRWALVMTVTENAGLDAGYPACSVGGTAASRIEESSLSFFNVCAFRVNIPTGTSLNVRVSRGGSGFIYGAFCTYVMNNLQSGVPLYTRYSFGGSPRTSNLDVQKGGVAAAMGYREVDGSFSWSGLTEDFDSANLADATAAMSGASAQISETSASFPISSSSGSHHQICASFR